jgi:putative transposase
MKMNRFSEKQITGILRQHEEGIKVEDLCREHGISAPTFHDWKSESEGLEASEAQRLRQMEDENRRLKRLVVELSLHNEVQKAVIRKNGWSWPV